MLHTHLSVAPPAAASSLVPYAGPWTQLEAGHLLRRASFGATYSEFNAAVAAGIDGTLTSLIEDLPFPEPPIATDPRQNDPLDRTWVDLPFDPEANRARNNNLSAWISVLIRRGGPHLREKMVLFWHNHFAIRSINDARIAYRYLDTLRQYAFGNFRDLVKAITIDPAMLRFLNGNSNRRQAPNENYARELLELFTIGKGPQVGPEDYTNYTEQDVRELARALTGWRSVGIRDPESAEIGAAFVPNRHDTTDKQLSPRFNEVIIQNQGENEYEAVVDIILQQPEVARFIVRKLYRWFVYYEISPEVEANIIEPLAQLFRDSDYEIKPVLETLFRSEHFFDVLRQGPMIKNPVDFIFQLVQNLQLDLSQEVADDEAWAYYRLTRLSNNLGMFHLNPPNVAGWKAYYQEPLYYRDWINSNTLRDRTRYTDQLTSNGLNLGRRIRVRPDLLNMVNQFPEPANLDGMIREFASFLLPRPLTDGQIAFLKDLVIPGLPETQWAIEYSDYLANPNDETIIAALETKLRRTMRAMLTMPEYQLS